MLDSSRIFGGNKCYVHRQLVGFRLERRIGCGLGGVAGLVSQWRRQALLGWISTVPLSLAIYGSPMDNSPIIQDTILVLRLYFGSAGLIARLRGRQVFRLVHLG